MDTPSLAKIRPSIERHALDYYAFGDAADVISRHGDIHSAVYLNDPLELHPTDPGVHRLAARMLVGINRFDRARSNIRSR